MTSIPLKAAYFWYLDQIDYLLLSSMIAETMVPISTMAFLSRFFFLESWSTFKKNSPHLILQNIQVFIGINYRMKSTCLRDIPCRPSQLPALVWTGCYLGLLTNSLLGLHWSLPLLLPGLYELLSGFHFLFLFSFLIFLKHILE